MRRVIALDDLWNWLNDIIIVLTEVMTSRVIDHNRTDQDRTLIAGQFSLHQGVVLDGFGGELPSGFETLIAKQ